MNDAVFPEQLTDPSRDVVLSLVRWTGSPADDPNLLGLVPDRTSAEQRELAPPTFALNIAKQMPPDER